MDTEPDGSFIRRPNISARHRQTLPLISDRPGIAANGLRIGFAKVHAA
jgi:hypothetical protein